jgi:hypothetical protein
MEHQSPSNRADVERGSLAGYLLIVLLMRHAQQRVELNFRRTYWTLYLGWSASVFVGNYLFFKIGIMSFLPRINNFVHTFIWIGLCLGFLYASAYRKPFWEQFALFAIFSFIVKWAEHEILSTWELNHFFFVRGNLAYIVGWSLVDGLYPLLSVLGLRIIARYVRGIIVS